MKKTVFVLCLSIFPFSLFLSGCGKKQDDNRPSFKLPTRTEKQEPVVQRPEKKEPKKDPEGQIHAAHILLMYKGSYRAPAQITRTKAEALALAQDLLQRIKDGADFSELAKKYSDCPSAKRGGDLGYFGKDQMSKSFEDAAFALKKGKVSGIVETEFGYHIIKRL